MERPTFMRAGCDAQYSRRKPNRTRRSIRAPMEPACRAVLQILQVPLGSGEVMFSCNNPAGEHIARVLAGRIIWILA